MKIHKVEGIRNMEEAEEKVREKKKKLDVSDIHTCICTTFSMVKLLQ